jgi:cytochrome c biogenesis protein CcmG, thiol:disulfide interchange protein DsbE
MGNRSWEGTLKWVLKHKLITGVVTVVVVVVAVLSVVTSGSNASTPRSDPKAASFSVSLLGASGAKISLSQYAGKPVIVNFWASWCPPCQQETPLLASWYRQEKGRVPLIGLDENDTESAALSFAHAKGVSYPIGFDPQTTAASAYGVAALPQTFFLNAKHQIVARVAGAVTPSDLTNDVRLMTHG